MDKTDERLIPFLQDLYKVYKKHQMFVGVYTGDLMPSIMFIDAEDDKDEDHVNNIYDGFSETVAISEVNKLQIDMDTPVHEEGINWYSKELDDE